MKNRYILPTAELLLVLPALLFMTALFVRNLQPMQYEPAHTAQQIVNWYALRPRLGLWILLIALPLTVLLSGSAAVLRRWTRESELRQAASQTLVILRQHWSSIAIAGATLAAGGILAIVALHVVSD